MFVNGSGYTWLCRSAEERARLLDMSRRLLPAQLLTIGAAFAFSLALIPTAGPALALSLVGVAAAFLYSRRRMRKASAPELWVLFSLLCAELLLAVGIAAGEGRERILLLVVLAGPPLMAACIWPSRASAAATALTAAVIVAVGFAVDAHAVLARPPLLTYPIATMVGCVLVVAAARGADVASRAAAAVDPLTGLLNRAALLDRAAELAHQAQLAAAPAALVLIDLDHFKAVNDRHGHTTGDEVLAGCAARLREALGNDGSLFRFGGEELVALLPDHGLAEARAVAERLRQALAREPVAGVHVTASFGVVAHNPTRAFNLAALLGEADRALYAAKAGGRNRVETRGAELRERSRREERRRSHRLTIVEAGSEPARRPLRLSVVAASERSWLARDQAERTHMLDLLGRIKEVRLLAYGTALVAILIAGPYYGFLPALPPLVSAVVMGVAIELAIRRSRRPELPIAGAVLFSQVVNAQAFLLTEQRPYFAIPLLAVLICAWAPMFPWRAVLLATAIEAGLMIECAVWLGGASAFASPYPLGVPLTALVGIAALAAAVGRSSVAHRGAAVVDRLTGMLNRNALQAKVAALSHELAFSPAPVSMIVVDIDRFKEVNDRFGHSRGDLVLREVAYRLRRALRAFDAAFRYGGEEFLVILTHVAPREAAEVGERLRTAVASQPVEGIPVTVSCGVAGCTPPDPFDFEALFEAADRRLYAAKRSGRNRVCWQDHQPTAFAQAA